MYQTMCCKHCGSENHWTAECPPRERAIKTCAVTIRGVTTEYVTKEDYDEAKGQYDQLVLVHKALQVSADVQVKNLQHELAKVKHESDYQCGVCGAVCSSRENLLFHVHLEAKSGRLRTRDQHISLMAALNWLHPASTPVPDRIDLT